MNHIRRVTGIVAGLAASLLAYLVWATAALAYPIPPPGGPALPCSHHPRCIPSSPAVCPAGGSR